MAQLKTNLVELESGSLRVAEKGSGRPYVLLNGFPFGSGEFVDVVESLSWSSRAVCVDIPWMVRSGIAGEGGAAEYADLLLYYFAKAGLDGFVLGATDIGGPIACELMEKAAGMVSGLLLWNTTVGAEGTRAPGYLESQRTTVINLFNPGARLINEIVKLMAAAGGLDEDFSACARENMDRPSRKAGLAAFNRLMGPSAPDHTKRLMHFRKPVSLCWGAEDRLCPMSNAASIEKALPGVQMTVLRGAGHFLGIEKPQDLSIALQEMGKKAWS